jgi:hypothetical protein
MRRRGHTGRVTKPRSRPRFSPSSDGFWRACAIEPTGADATIFAFVAGTLCPHFDTPLRTAAECHNNLRRYIGRMTARYYPDLGEIAGCKSAA